MIESQNSAISASLLRFMVPIARLLLRHGIGATEFIALSKAAFIQAATEDYGIRGRPTNVSRVSAMTGLSRKEVKRFRSTQTEADWTPRDESTPLNEVLHHWFADKDFQESDGSPRILPFSGDLSFSSLANRYAGDIPPGALRKELAERGAIEELSGGERIKIRTRFVQPSGNRSDFVHGASFSLAGLASTLAHNFALIERIDVGSEETHECIGRIERTAWTDHMTPAEIDNFQLWVRESGAAFIELADREIGRRELARDLWHESSQRTVGVGLYYFEN